MSKRIQEIIAETNEILLKEFVDFLKKNSALRLYKAGLKKSRSTNIEQFTSEYPAHSWVDRCFSWDSVENPREASWSRLSSRWEYIARNKSRKEMLFNEKDFEEIQELSRDDIYKYFKKSFIFKGDDILGRYDYLRKEIKEKIELNEKYYIYLGNQKYSEAIVLKIDKDFRLVAWDVNCSKEFKLVIEEGRYTLLMTEKEKDILQKLNSIITYKDKNVTIIKRDKIRIDRTSIKYEDIDFSLCIMYNDLLIEEGIYLSKYSISILIIQDGIARDYDLLKSLSNSIRLPVASDNYSAIEYYNRTKQFSTKVDKTEDIFTLLKSNLCKNIDMYATQKMILDKLASSFIFNKEEYKYIKSITVNYFNVIVDIEEVTIPGTEFKTDKYIMKIDFISKSILLKGAPHPHCNIDHWSKYNRFSGTCFGTQGTLVYKSYIETRHIDGLLHLIDDFISDINPGDVLLSPRHIGRCPTCKEIIIGSNCRCQE